MKSGVYEVRVGPYRYYGRSVNVEHRKAVHKSALKHGRHDSPHLQAAFHAYGMFDFRVLTFAPEDHLERIEQAVLTHRFDDPLTLNKERYANTTGRARPTAVRRRISQIKTQGKQHTFLHPTHGKFVGSCWDLRQAYPDVLQPDISKVVHGHRKSTKGWVLCQES